MSLSWVLSREEGSAFAIINFFVRHRLYILVEPLFLKEELMIAKADPSLYLTPAMSSSLNVDI